MTVPLYLPIPYLNTSGEAVPRFGVLELVDQVDTASGTDVFAVKVRKPTNPNGVFAIDSGKGAGASGAERYGQCYIPVSHVTWVAFNGTAPAMPWDSQVGPVMGQWYMDTSSSGYWWAGGYASAQGWLLVNQSSGGSQVMLGRATTSIVHATNSLTGATLFTFREFLTLDASVTPHTEQEASVDSTGVNRFTHLDAPANSIVVVARINGELQLIGVEEVCSE